jgi:hypothetical protein
MRLRQTPAGTYRSRGTGINEVAGPGTPPSEEQFATIATMLNNPKEGTQYALAAQWLDALTEYTSILHEDFQMPTDETMTYVAKYTTPVVNGDNAAVAAFVQTKLASLNK